MLNLRKSLFLILACKILLFAEGGPPMLTDGPGTPGNGNWEINVGYTGNLRTEMHRYEQPIIDINYGLGDHIQLKTETSYIGLHRQDQHFEGAGNTKIGIKWRFYEKDDLLISTYPQFGFAPIRSHIATGVAEYNTMYVLPIEITKKIDRFWATAEGGYIWMSDTANRMKYGLVGGYEITPLCTVMAEVFGTSNIGGSANTTIANFGLTYAITSNFSMLLSAGRELATPESDKGRLFYSGFQFKF